MICDFGFDKNSGESEDFLRIIGEEILIFSEERVNSWGMTDPEDLIGEREEEERDRAAEEFGDEGGREVTGFGDHDLIDIEEGD